ncbi:MAG: hypothetical protein QY326_00840 [Bdellovibrionota bacterium]|nr:MAG: hypothetical protein QY326_00840 [Bdellovibrionota bacterium]
MSKPSPSLPLCEDKEEAFEIIELASQELLTLADAFNLIAAVCEERDATLPVETPPSEELH